MKRFLAISLRFLKLDNELRRILPIDITMRGSKNMDMLIAGSNKIVGSAVTSHYKVRKTLLVCGILSALIWIGTDILASLLYEGYNYPLQPISGLSSPDSPVRSLLNPLLIPYTVLKIAFAMGVWWSAGRKRTLRITASLLFAWGIGDLVAYFFPWKPNDSLLTINNIIHGILSGGLPVLSFLLIIVFGASADGKWFRYYSYGTLLASFAAGGVMAVFGNLQIDGGVIPPWFGLTERINTYGFMLWMLAFAAILLRVKPSSSNLADRENIIIPDAITS